MVLVATRAAYGVSIDTMRGTCRTPYRRQMRAPSSDPRGATGVADDAVPGTVGTTIEEAPPSYEHADVARGVKGVATNSGGMQRRPVAQGAT